jgi:hypothetical protein
MRNRRFLILAAVLVALNVTLFLTPAGYALTQVAIPPLFGKNLAHADLTLGNGNEWRIARGIVLTNAAGVITVQEKDGHVEPINVNSSTKVTGTAKPISASGIKAGWRILATWPAPSGNADAITVEKK